MKPSKVTGTFTVSADTLVEAVKQADGILDRLLGGANASHDYSIRCSGSFKQINANREVVFMAYEWDVEWWVK